MTLDQEDAAIADLMKSEIQANAVLGDRIGNKLASPTNKLCFIDTQAEPPVVAWHRAGESHYRELPINLLIGFKDEVRDFDASGATLIGAVAALYDQRVNTRSLILRDALARHDFGGRPAQ